MLGMHRQIWKTTIQCILLTASLWAGAHTALAETATRSSAFEYDPVTGLLTKEIIEPGNAELCLVTQYTYDNYGNQLSATTRNCNGSAGSHPGINTEAAAPATNSVAKITPTTASTTYDAQGRFPVTSTNALGHTETKVFDSQYGNITSLTGPNGLATTWTYDSFGRVLSESRADGTGTQTSYTLCSGNCPANVQYKITATQAGAPTNTAYYDLQGRVIQSDTQDKNGATISTYTEYDHLGRISRSSRPAKSGQTLAWTTITYDVLNRPISSTAPDNSVTTTTYNGLVTVTTNAKGQTRTEQVNSQGQTIRITDSNNQPLLYQYDAYGNLKKTTDAAGNITTLTYDARGRKIAMNDPDQGNWTYAYDAKGQLKTQTDAKGQVTSFVYDPLGRMLQRTEPDLISNWVYDTCQAGNETGKCKGKLVKETSSNDQTRLYYYDQYGRMAGEYDQIDGNYGVAKTFDTYGRVSLLWYPDGFMVKNIYTSTGHLSEVRNGATNALYWRAGTTDAEGHVTQETYGNGITTNRAYNPNTGHLTQTSSGANGSINNQSFVYDSLGNLTQRYDAVTGLNESFGYDTLNRLISTTAVSGSTTTAITVNYNAIGNITYKSDIGTYTYGVMVNGVLTKPHAVTSITKPSGGNYATYTYDANGNNLTGWGRTTQWTSWNMPSSITKDGKTFTFVYNSAHERIKQIVPYAGTTTQTIYNISPRLDTGIHVERRVRPFVEQYVYYLYAGTMPFGTVTKSYITPPASSHEPPFTDIKTHYFHTDHLGSIVAITDETGALTERRSYDAWGKRRNLNGTPITSLLTTPDERHGYTGHEELSEIGIVHMNGRMYDPATGRFLSADPTVQYPDDMQNYNRYSYINNNPLSATDPSGFGFLSKVFKGVKNAVKGVVKGVSSALKNPIIRTAASVAAAYYVGVSDGGIFGAGHAISNGAAGGFAGGLVAGRGDLRVALQGAVTGAAMGYVGDTWGAGTWKNIAGHAAVGCGSSLASGGSCQSGAMAGGFSGWANPHIPTSLGLGGAVASAVVGGTASILGGGKFENGAMTGAFGYLFNKCQHEACFEFLRKRGLSTEDIYNPSTDTLNGYFERKVYQPIAGSPVVEWSGKGDWWYDFPVSDVLPRVPKTIDFSIGIATERGFNLYPSREMTQVYHAEIIGGRITSESILTNLSTGRVEYRRSVFDDGISRTIFRGCVWKICSRD